MKTWLLVACFVGVTFGRPGHNNGHSKNGDNTSIDQMTVKNGGQCGTSKFLATLSQDVATSRIVGGQTASNGQFPWQVGIVDKGYLICGGSYVLGRNGEVKVITAAHCIEVNRPRRFSVVFGMQNTQDTNGRLVVDVTRIIKHSGYSELTMSNDIAILEVATTEATLEASTFAKPICLASRDYTSGEVAYVSGWGTTEEDGSSSSQLLWVEKTLLSYDYCNTQTGNAGDLDSTMMCAGEAGKDACQGDSGGPLAVYRNGVDELVGVVSWGYGCGRDNFPGVYADVWALRNWLGSNL